jgi:hypothetical protein
MAGVIAAGLGLIGFVYLLMLGSLAARGEIRIMLGVAAILLNVAAAVGFIGLLALEHDSPFESTACPIPRADSDYAPSHFSWIPPGRVCDYPTGDVGPTYWRIPAAIAIVGLPGAWVALWPLRRRAEDELLDAIVVNGE